MDQIDAIFQAGKRGKLRIGAHRGGPLERYEHTLDTAKVSMLDVGADIFECDVIETKDGQLVLFHDLTLDRMTGQPDLIWDLNYDEIEPYLDNIVVQSAPF